MWVSNMAVLSRTDFSVLIFNSNLHTSTDRKLPQKEARNHDNGKKCVVRLASQAKMQIILNFI